MGVVSYEKLRSWREKDTAGLPEEEIEAYNIICARIGQSILSDLSNGSGGKSSYDPFGEVNIVRIVVNYQGQPYSKILEKIENEIETKRMLYSIYGQGVNFLP